MAPALQQLRRLHLNGPWEHADGDAVVERLLGLPHLTSLSWDRASWHAFQRSHASSPCRWKQLSLTSVLKPYLLARLPLHSLTSPFAWETIVVDEHTSVAGVQAAADNVTRRCPAGGVWTKPEGAWWPSVDFAPDDSRTFTRGAGEGDTPAALLRALQPLLAAPGLQKLAVTDLAWDAELVKVLGQVVPRTCVRLRLQSGSLTAGAAVQLARSLPWLEELQLDLMDIHPPHSVAVYVGAATSIPGGACLTEVGVTSPVRPEDVDAAAHLAAWVEVQETVRSLGVAFTLHVGRRRAARRRA